MKWSETAIGADSACRLRTDTANVAASPARFATVIVSTLLDV
jgi:hypothetical protein